jgi:hypothetical protein
MQGNDLLRLKVKSASHLKLKIGWVLTNYYDKAMHQIFDGFDDCALASPPTSFLKPRYAAIEVLFAQQGRLWVWVDSNKFMDQSQATTPGKIRLTCSETHLNNF